MSAPKDTPTSKKQRLTLTQLASYDDILTDALVDHVFYWTTVPKNRSSYHPSRGVRDTVISDIVQRHVVIDKDLEAGVRQLLATDGLKRFVASLKTDQERDDFRRHARRYLQIYLPDCPWEVNTTNRYTIVSHEASVTARRLIRRNETIKYLSGIQVIITAAEEMEMAVRKKDFSLVVSSRNKCTSLFMGPARFANHDCDANAKLVTTGQAGIEIIATRQIDVGEEITVTYGDSYFGQDNCECLCYTCEQQLCNGWAPQGDGAVSIKTSVESHEDDCSGESYSLRRRRRDSTTSRTPSVTPGIRPRILRSKPKRSTLGNGNSAGPSPVPRDCGSSTQNTPRGRKRPMDGVAMATPPITPAKRFRNAMDDSPAQSNTSRGSSHSRGVSPTSGDAMDTDMTSPEQETPEPKIKTEAGFQSFPPPPPPPPLDDSRHKDGTLYESMSHSQASGPVGSIAASIEAEATGQAEQVEAAPQRKKYTRRVFIKQTTPPPARQRTPGDYVLTRLLLSEPETAWIQCTNCMQYFVQQNAYFTKCSCPRCERHSKLYGYLWPKTDKAGPGDREERVLDHRTVHRFLDSRNERRARGRKGFLEKNDDEGSNHDHGGDCSETKRKTGAAVQARTRARDNDGPALRRTGRMRKASGKLDG